MDMDYTLALIGKSAVLWVQHPTIAENFTEVFGIILAFGYMSLFKYMYQNYHNILHSEV